MVVLTNTIMKTSGVLTVALMLASGWTASYGQAGESAVPGDNFSLEGALELFKKSASPEAFERSLNDADSKVNNLDLNGDGYIDYIRVIDRQDGNVHAFILQAVVSERESQDVAVIELEKLSNGKAVLQIVGDEDVFGIETIIEPTQEVRTYAGTTTVRPVVNVWVWPSVQYVYTPYYSAWSSPWGWHHRPIWWRSWRPITYVRYYSIWDPYRPYYSVCHTRRAVYAHDIYRPYRTASVYVVNRHRSQLMTYRSEHRDRSAHDDRYRNGRNRTNERQAYRSQIEGRDRTSADDRFRADNRQFNNDRSVNRSSEQRRAESNVTRTTTTPRKVQAPAERSRSVERRMPADFRQNATEPRGERTPVRTSGVQRNREIPQQMERSSKTDRGTSSEMPRMQERSTPRSNANVRSTPSEDQRTSPLQRSAPSRSSETVRGNRDVPQQVSRPATMERSRPAGSSNAQQRSSPRTSGNRTRGGE
jgi:hypothetical protein